MSPSKYKPPQARNAKDPPLNHPSEYKPPRRLLLGNCPTQTSSTKRCYNHYHHHHHHYHHHRYYYCYYRTTAYYCATMTAYFVEISNALETT